MGHYVGVSFSFSVCSLRRLKQVANETICEIHLAEGYDTEKFNRSYTLVMLKNAADNTEKYIHYGNKGDMFIWGGVWNYYDALEEIPYLKFFLKKCWGYCNSRDGVFFDFDKALLIVNHEQSHESEIYEFGLNEETKGVDVRETKIDLNWGQM